MGRSLQQVDPNVEEEAIEPEEHAELIREGREEEARLESDRAARLSPSGLGSALRLGLGFGGCGLGSSARATPKDLSHSLNPSSSLSLSVSPSPSLRLSLGLGLNLSFCLALTRVGIRSDELPQPVSTRGGASTVASLGRRSSQHCTS